MNLGDLFTTSLQNSCKLILFISVIQATFILLFGTLEINGDANDPVIFTSFSDDNYGGDSNGDGDLTSPQSGD